jgi:hypothetical protein
MLTIVSFLHLVMFTFWNYYVLKLLRLETIMFSDAMLSDLNVVLCYVLSQWCCAGNGQLRVQIHSSNFYSTPVCTLWCQWWATFAEQVLKTEKAWSPLLFVVLWLEVTNLVNSSSTPVVQLIVPDRSIDHIWSEAKFYNIFLGFQSQVRKRFSNT